MLFLGRAANFRFLDVVRHTFAWGTERDSEHFARYLSWRYQADFSEVFLYYSGRSAISAALRALLPEGGAVAINGLTCHAVVQAVKHAMCTPVFVDVKPDDVNYGLAQLQRAYKANPNIKAIMIQNTLGKPVNILPLERFAKKHHLVLIEDLAHSAGVRYVDGRMAGTVGSAVALSFGKGKAVDTSTGGALIIRDPNARIPRRPRHRPRLSDSLRARWYPWFGLCMRAFTHIRLQRFLTGFLRLMHWIEPSADTKLDLNTRLTHWQAKLALRQFKKISAQDQPPLRDFYLVTQRRRVLAELQQKGYYFDEIWYSPPISPERYFARANFPSADCPNSVKVSEAIINVPTHYTKAQVAPAIKIIKRYTK